jgi:hypothetical protein
MTKKSPKPINCLIVYVVKYTNIAKGYMYIKKLVILTAIIYTFEDLNPH